MSLANRALASSPWSQAALLLERWVEDQARADALLESLPPSITGRDRARCQHLFFGALRHKGRIEAHLRGLLRQAPRARVSAVFWLSGYELIEGGEEGHAARVVHHAVEQTKQLASEGEAKMVNAVVRKLAASIEKQPAPGKFATSDALGDYFSHPQWLVARWLAQYGAEATRHLLEWNQTPAPLYGRWRSPEPMSTEEKAALRETTWPGFVEVVPGNWAIAEDAIKKGKLYIQDPSTHLAVELVGLQPHEDFFDACASPGGKILAIADARAAGSGKLVAMDLPGVRQERLRENAAKARGASIAVVAGDIADTSGAALRNSGAPMNFDAVLLDVPCSNTGVMRHRVDVRWRLQPADLGKHARQQLVLLRAAASRVKPGGRLIYSTCSLDREENEGVIDSFVKGSGGKFSLEDKRQSLPWESGCDGAGAFRLRRVTG